MNVHDPKSLDLSGGDGQLGGAPGRRVLIVEDELIIAWELAEILQDLGYEVCGTAIDAEEAKRLVVELEPDLVLMDVRLRGNGDGITAAAAILAERPVPVVFCTAFAEDPTTRRRLESLATAVVAKPVRPDLLGRALARAFGD